LKRILNVAVEAGLLERNPTLGVKLPKFDNRRGRVIDAEEYKRLLVAVNSRKAPHLRPILMLAYETGMRTGEILGLRWADVDLKRHFLRLPKTKNGDARDVPLSDAAERALRERGRGDSTFVFPARGTHGHLTTINHPFRRLAARAGIEGVRFHDLRHTFTTRKLEEGWPMRVIMAVTGYRSVAMYHRYSHPSKAAMLGLVRDAEKVSPHLSPQRARGSA